MKIIAAVKYILTPISYGLAFAMMLLLLVPQLRQVNPFLQSTTQPPKSYATAVSLAGPAVVNIYSTDINKRSNYRTRDRQPTRLGSGVIMAGQGYILTNYHVVEDAALIQVWLQSGQHYAAELIGFDIPTDLAVLKVEGNNLPTIPQQPNLNSYAGDVVLAIGNPLNLGQTVTQGIISATGRNGLSNTSYLEFLQMDAAINDGNSGGALVNTNGELVGINSRKFTQLNPQLNIQGIFFAVPYQLANKVMQKIIANGRVVRGWLGIISSHYLVNLKGIVIDQVAPASPALKAGLQSGDVIYQIGETPISSITQALDLVAETTPNSEVIFKIYRGKKSFDITVTVTEYKIN